MIPTTSDVADGVAVATIAELADRERVSRLTLLRLAAAGRLPGAYRVGRQWRVSVAEYASARRSASDDARRIMESTRNAQGLRPCIDDPSAIEQVVGLLAARS